MSQTGSSYESLRAGRGMNLLGFCDFSSTLNTRLVFLFNGHLFGYIIYILLLYYLYLYSLKRIHYNSAVPTLPSLILILKNTESSYK